MRSPLVLCYHAVSDAWPDPLAIPAVRVEAQIRSLVRRGMRAVSAEGVLNGAHGTFHVTFDDAFRSIEPVIYSLRQLGIPVTVFACPAFAGGPRRLDVPELQERARDAPWELETMGWDALRELVLQGAEIGSHTVSHPHLTRLDDGELRRELRLSAEQIESELGRPCRLLAYPFGENDTRVRSAAREAGYVAAFGLTEQQRMVDRFNVSRVGIYRADGKVRFALKSSLGPSTATKLADARQAIRRYE